MRMAEEQLKQVTNDREEQQSLWRKERSELQLKVQELITHQEKGKHDKDKQLEKYREKSATYKQKLRLAL